MSKDPSVAYLESVAKNINMIFMTGSVSCHTLMCSQCPFNLHSGCFLAQLDDLVDKSILIRRAVDDLNGQNKHATYKHKSVKPVIVNPSDDTQLNDIGEALKRYFLNELEGGDNNETENS